MSAARLPGLDVLARVPLLTGLPRGALEEVASRCEVRRFSRGERLVAELELGEEALVVLEGTGRVTVGGLSDEPPVEVGEVGPGDVVGEMALFTGELRSATVTASAATTVLVLERDRFHDLMARYPQTGAHLSAALAERLKETERVLTSVLDPTKTHEERKAALASARGHRRARSRALLTAIRVAWRELVSSHLRQPAFLMLVAFVGALSFVRLAIDLTGRYVPDGPKLEEMLRVSYESGLFLLIGSGIGSLLWFRPDVRRVMATLFGAGMAMLFNSLPVLLTFDLFYQDIFTPDPNLTFSVAELYRRSEGAHVVVVIGAFLLQLVLLRRFYRRILFLITFRTLRRVG